MLIVPIFSRKVRRRDARTELIVKVLLARPRPHIPPACIERWKGGCGRDLACGHLAANHEAWPRVASVGAPDDCLEAGDNTIRVVVVVRLAVVVMAVDQEGVSHASDVPEWDIDGLGVFDDNDVARLAIPILCWVVRRRNAARSISCHALQARPFSHIPSTRSVRVGWHHCGRGRGGGGGDLAWVLGDESRTGFVLLGQVSTNLTLVVDGVELIRALICFVTIAHEARSAPLTLIPCIISPKDVTYLMRKGQVVCPCLLCSDVLG